MHLANVNVLIEHLLQMSLQNSRMVVWQQRVWETMIGERDVSML